MPESSLTLKKSDLYAKVGFQFGFGLGEDEDDTPWDAQQLYAIKDCVDSGTRRFYQAHSWSFLRPFVTLTLSSGGRSVWLPDDFGGIEGSIAVSSSDSQVFRPLEVINPGLIEQKYSQSPDRTGRPEFAAVRQVKGTTTERSSRQDLYVFPEADAAYTLKFRYYLTGNALSDDNPYAYGGAEHSETLLAAALAVKEERYDRIPNGPDMIAFMRLLNVSVARDNKKKSQYFGINRDTSDDLGVQDFENYSPVLINGVDYSS